MFFFGVDFALDGSLDQGGLEARSPAGTLGQFPDCQMCAWASIDTNKHTVRVATQG